MSGFALHARRVIKINKTPSHPSKSRSLGWSVFLQTALRLITLEHVSALRDS